MKIWKRREKGDVNHERLILSRKKNFKGDSGKHDIFLFHFTTVNRIRGKEKGPWSPHEFYLHFLYVSRV